MPQKTKYPRMPIWKYQKYPPPTVPSGPPTVVDVPHATGTGAVGATLHCTMGNWTNQPTSYGYQWLRSGAAIAGATTNSYTTVSADNGTNISCNVTATNSFGSGNSTSNSIQITTLLMQEAEGEKKNTVASF
jgi:hypothetical protein